MRSDHLSKHKRTHAVRQKVDIRPDLDAEEEGEVVDGGAMDEADDGVGQDQEGVGMVISDVRSGGEPGAGQVAQVVPVGPPVATSVSGTLFKVQELMPATLAEMQSGD